jgi:hypothetical protein
MLALFILASSERSQSPDKLLRETIASVLY